MMINRRKNVPGTYDMICMYHVNTYQISHDTAHHVMICTVMVCIVALSLSFVCGYVCMIQQQYPRCHFREDLSFFFFHLTDTDSSGEVVPLL